ncbi:DUF421 domain-containing protein [Roseicyclus sp. F158]|uniref:DUF421 domain-containing protein n=1 Tax=Tropicimonas omnivorans TaxID=3075590 RepID=A0ABU3DI87_9RHOB|nr:YetF domain-containing protein [Roseicyclus sp. F158]MDT0683426.1 DUF421 domain-containing protein [Roseicyclus sp. F158]
MFFDDEGAYWHIPVAVVLGFLLLLFLLRLSGKRTVAQFNMYDMILTFTVGSVLSSFIILDNVAFLDAAIALASLIAMDYVISLVIMKSDGVRKLVRSQPALLVFKGELQHANMRRERVIEDEVLMFMRQRGVDRLSHVSAMILEPAGDVSVFSDAQDHGDVAKSLQRSGVDIPG